MRRQIALKKTLKETLNLYPAQDNRDKQVAGSTPGHRVSCSNPGHVVHSQASVTKQYNLAQAQGRWNSAAGKVTEGLALLNSWLAGCTGRNDHSEHW